MYIISCGNTFCYTTKNLATLQIKCSDSISSALNHHMGRLWEQGASQSHQRNVGYCWSLNVKRQWFGILGVKE